MMIAIIILTALLFFQFIAAIKWDCVLGWDLCSAMRLSYTPIL